MDTQVSWVPLPPARAHSTQTPLPVPLTQIAVQLSFQLATRVCVNCQVDAFVTHMKLGSVWPLWLQSGGDLLGRPARFEHFCHDLKELAPWQQAGEASGFAPPLSCQCAGLDNFIVVGRTITFELTAKAA